MASDVKQFSRGRTLSETLPMMNISHIPSPYTFTDRLFLRWVEQTDWTPNTKRVCRVLFEHQRKHSQVYLLHITIARWLGISVATVKRSIRFLVGLGILHVTPQVRHDGGNGSNQYKVIPHILPTSALSPRLPVSEASDPVLTEPTLLGTTSHDGDTEVAANSPDDTPLALESFASPSTPAVSPEASPLPFEQAGEPRAPGEIPVKDDLPAFAESPSRARGDVESVGHILASWTPSQGFFSDKMTPEGGQNDPTPQVTQRHLSIAPSAIAGSTPDDKGKISLRKKINNINTLPRIDHPTLPEEPIGGSPVVVFSEPQSERSSPSPQPAESTPSPHPESKQKGEKEPIGASLWHKLLNIGSQETVQRVLEWLKACPPNHPARPKNPAAWVYTAVKENWQTPPTWVSPPEAPKIRYRVLAEEDVQKNTQPLAPNSAIDPEWIHITTFLASDSASAQEFLQQVERMLSHRLGGELARRALASHGPVWQTVCREIWRSLAASQASA